MDIIDLGPDTSPGQHGTNFNAPYRGVVASGRVAPGTLDAVRQAIIAARLRRLRQTRASLGDTLSSVGEQSSPMERLGRLGETVTEGLARGLTDTLDMAAMGPAMRAIVQLNPTANPAAVEATHNPNPALQAGDAAGLTHSDYTPPDATSRAVLEGSRFLGGGIIPETAIARFGANVARRVADGVAESSLSRMERMALDYVRQPGRVLAANVTGAAGSVAGGHAAAAINPALEPVGQIVGGLLGGGIPFAGRGHVEDLGPVDGMTARASDEPLASVATVEPDTPNARGAVYDSDNVRITSVGGHEPTTATAVDAPHAVGEDLGPLEPGPGRREPEQPAAPVRNDFRPATPTEREELGYDDVGDVHVNPDSGEVVSFDHHPSKSLSDFDYTDSVTGRGLSGTFNHETGEFTYRAHRVEEGAADLRHSAEGAVEQAYDSLVQRTPRQRPYASAGEREANKFPEYDAPSPPEAPGPSPTPDPSIDPEGIYRTDQTGGQAPPEPPSGGRGNGNGGDEPPEPPAPPPGDGEEPPHPSDSVIKRLTTALNRARRLTPEQRAATSASRSEKIARVRGVREGTSGEAGYHAELGQLRGETPKVEFEGVRDQFTQPEVDTLFDRIKNHPDLTIFDQIHARAGLAKLLDGTLPTPSELSLLGRAFPKNFIAAILRNRSMMSKIVDVAANVLNIPRALMSSFDLSAPFRQGLFVVGRKEFWKAWPEMFRQFVHGFGKDDAAFEGFMNEIRSRPNYDMMESSKLALGSLDHNLSTREEAFMSSYAERIPLAGRVVKASERAYTAFLNKVRADTFDSLVELSRKAGIDLDTDKKALRDIASFINNATGRGNLGKLNSSAPLLNAMFFSPRLIASRVTLLNPAYYATLSPVVRREAIKSLLSLGAIATTVLGLARAGGMRVETDPRSADFGKVRNGDVRYDILGGFGQYITLGARLVTNQTKSLDGQVSTLGSRYGSRTRFDTLVNFGVNKFSPITSFVTDFLRGKDAVGQPFNLSHAAASRVTPLFVQDIVDVMQDKGAIGAAEAVPGAFGVGIQTIPPSHAIDHLGRHVADLPETETDPVALEVARLNTNPNSSLIGNPRRTNVLIGDTRRNLTDEEYQRYQETSGHYILEDIRTEMASPEWRRMSDGDKRDAIRAIVRDQRANARDELFAGGSTDIQDLGSVQDLGPAPAQAPRGSGLISDARSAILSVFPQAQVTSFRRDPNSRLGRMNPNSYHNTNNSPGSAVDIRPIHGLTFDEYLTGLRNAGYRIIDPHDEQRHPTFDTTGPNWHVVLAR